MFRTGNKCQVGALKILVVMPGKFLDCSNEMHYWITNELVEVIIMTRVDSFDVLLLGLVKDLTISALHPEM